MSTRRRFLVRAALCAAVLLPLPAVAGPLPFHPLSGPSAAPPSAIARDYLAAHAGELGLAATDLAEVAVTDVVPTRHNGATHVYLRQRVNGLEIDGAEMGVHVDRLGRVFFVTGRFVPAVAARAAETPAFPRLGPDEAVVAAARALGLAAVDGLEVVETPGGAARAVTFRNAAVSERPIPVRLRYHRTPDADALRLTWNLSLKDPSSADWWDVWVDAGTGALVARANWTADATYRVFPRFHESPDNGDRTDEVDPNDVTASPFGWHDLNGVAGAETTLTSGNNVNACVDADGNNACDPGSQPDGGASLVFQPPLDLTTQQPAEYRPAAVVNLYYWNNVVHDVLYQYGFDEVAGNFQENNYGHGGAASDSVNADAQDGSGTNNANFATPVDGQNPRMQMFVWTSPVGLLINAPPAIAGSYPAGTASFGPQTFNLTQDLVLVNDSSGTNTEDGCCNDANALCVNPVWPGVTGKIALLRRGNCEFGTKTVNAQNAGAIGVVLINNQGDGIVLMGPGVNGGAAVIPILSVGQSNGNLFVANLPGVNATMNSALAVGPNRDSDLDAGVIAHEYGHGLSNRLTGGPMNVGCLQNAEQMGEGWSDWITLFLHAEAGDTATTRRPIGTYVNFESQVTGTGIRRYPYTTDMAVNPFTYADVADPVNPQPHGIGSIWATMLWDMYWNLVDVMGYDPDVYHGTGGNNVAFQLVTDGLKLQVCSPGFVDGRNAILAADAADYEGENTCDIWRAFARRGLGLNASQGSSNNRNDGVEDFTLPPACVDLIFADGFGMGDTRRWTTTAP